MAAVSVTAANVGIASALTPRASIAGETITQGQWVYLASGKVYVATCASTAAKADVYGLALTPAVLDEDILIALNGDVKPGGTVVATQMYYLGSAGTSVPYADLVSTNYVTEVMRGVTTSTSSVRISATGLTL